MHEIYHISELEKIHEKPRLTSRCTLPPSTMARVSSVVWYPMCLMRPSVLPYAKLIRHQARREALGNWRRRARFKLQDDAVATSILGRLCEQFPEVFQTHVMPHLQDADLISLFLLGTSPQGVSPRSFQVLDRFVGVDPDGRAYCKMCRLKNGRDFGKTNLTTLPALRGHAERAVFRSGPCARRYLRLPPEAHGEMRDAIDAVLCRSS